MDAKFLLSVVLASVVGMLLMSKGITGMAIAAPQDSCQPAQCAQASLDAGSSAHFNFLLGAVLLLLSIYAFAWRSGREDAL